MWRSDLSDGDSEEDEEAFLGFQRDFELYFPRGRYDRFPPTAAVRGRILGSYRSFCQGSIVLGPQPFMFIFHLVSFLTLLGLFCFQFQDVRMNLGLSVWLVGLGFYIISIYLFIRVGLTDPGVVPMHYSLHELLRDTSKYRLRNDGARFYRFCSKCQGYRPPQCFHCKICKICIKGQQFHNTAVGTCIGNRNIVPFLLLSFILGLFSWYLIIVNAYILSKKVRPPTAVGPSVLSIIGLLSGLMLILIPNIGFISFFYRLRVLLTGKQRRYFFEALRPDELDCPRDKLSVRKRFRAVFCSRRPTSAFRLIRSNYFGTFGRMHWGRLENYVGSQGIPPGLREFRHEMLQRQAANIIDIPPPGTGRPSEVSPEEAEEAKLLRALAAHARIRQTPSVPEFDSAKRKIVPSCLPKGSPFRVRYKNPTNKSKSANNRKVTPLTATTRCIEEKGFVTLSDGNIPSSFNGDELIQRARAEQFLRLIRLILIQDTNGIMQMSRRINLPGLLGINRFIPSDLQFVELSNGLPMITTRRDPREPQIIRPVQSRFGGLLGIPQMVAAGLLPLARVIARDVETSLGLVRGSVIRIDNDVRLPIAATLEISRARQEGNFPLTARSPFHRTAERQLLSRNMNLSLGPEQLRRLLFPERQGQPVLTPDGRSQIVRYHSASDILRPNVMVNQEAENRPSITRTNDANNNAWINASVYSGLSHLDSSSSDD